MKHFFRPASVAYQQHQLTGQVILKYPRLYQILSWTIVALLLAVIAYFTWGRMHQKTQVVGYLHPSKGVMRYSAPMTARVHQIKVDVNTYVQAGAPLIELIAEHHVSGDDELHRAREQELEQRSAHLARQITLAKQQQQERDAELTAEFNALSLQRAKLDDYRQIAKQQLKLSKSKWQALQKLAEQGAIAQIDVKQQHAVVLSHEATLAELQQREAEIQAKQVQNEQARAHLPTQYAQQYEQLAMERSQLKSQALEIQSQGRYWLTASQSGVVTHIYPHIGDQVHAGAPLVNLMPEESQLQAVLLIPSQSIGFVKAGQVAKLKLDAFPYQRFGFQQAQIREVTEHVLMPHELGAPVVIDQPVYRVIAQLESKMISAYGHPVHLKAGMTFHADVLLDQHPIWMWLFEPILSLRGHL